MVKVTLSILDIAGQDRFESIKPGVLKGSAVIGLVFDLSRPNTFNKVDMYLQLIRKKAGNIPILLIGNKKDITDETGETIPRKKIIEKVNQNDLMEYIETSALKSWNIDKLFNRLATMGLLDIRPRRGEIRENNHFVFKVLLVGAAAVGKTTMIKSFLEDGFSAEYKLTVGLDFHTYEFQIPDEELPQEVSSMLSQAAKKAPKSPKLKRSTEIPIKKPKKPSSEREPIKPSEKGKSKDLTIPLSSAEKVVQKHSNLNPMNYIYLIIVILAMIIIIGFLLNFLE